MRRYRTLAMWTVCLSTLVGCGPKPNPLGPGLVKQFANTPYPKDAPAEDLNIVVVRDGPAIVLMNRTPRTYQNMYLWLNQQYVGKAPHIPIGTETRLELTGFINEHREPFPIGGPLTPDKSSPVVLAELYGQLDTNNTTTPANTAKRYRLLVRRAESE